MRKHEAEAKFNKSQPQPPAPTRGVADPPKRDEDTHVTFSESNNLRESKSASKERSSGKSSGKMAELQSLLLKQTFSNRLSRQNIDVKQFQTSTRNDKS